MSYNYDADYSRFSTKKPKANDVWLAKVPYTQDGNWFKTRPVWIKEINNDNIVIRKITTKGDPKHNYPIQFNKKNKKQSYISYEETEIERYRLIRKIGRYEEI